MNLDKYNVIWNSPSVDAAGSMPIGNGSVAANVWATDDGVLHFYVSRTDSWSEICRLLKISGVEIKFTPNPFQKTFSQTLQLQQGRIHFKAGGLSMDLFMDANQPVIWITGRSAKPIQVEAKLISWRTAPKRLEGYEQNSAWTMQGAPFPLIESADHFVTTPEAQISYHRNETSVVNYCLDYQGLGEFRNLVGDPLLHRTFGALLSGSTTRNGDVENAKSTASNGIEFNGGVSYFQIKVATECAQTATSADFLAKIKAIFSQEPDLKTVANRTLAWWHQFWNRSYIEVTPGNNASPADEENCFKITQGYALQRFMLASASRGKYPLKFNGSLFTVEPKALGEPYDPDWRRWGDGYWWQNTRIPYWAMVASGDYDGMESLFHLYESVLGICKARAKAYYNADGAYFPETISFFGSYSNSDYGWDRKPGQPANEFAADYWKYAYNQGPELVQMMLDRYKASPDKKFLREELLPMAKAVLDYFGTRFPRDSNGTLRIDPDQAIETYWYGVINDTPVVSGLHAVLPRLLRLPSVSSRDRANWKKLLSILPPIAVENGKIMPAEKFNPQRNNVENPEFYAIWPFREFGVGRPGLDIAQKTFNERIEKANFGWQYDGQTAALCGLADEAQKSLISKAFNSNPKFRFPATWGPNYDWLPDQDHGSNLMLTLQSMLLQSVGDKTYTGPAWPTNWNVRFKLHALNGKLIQAGFTAGKWTTDKPE